MKHISNERVHFCIIHTMLAVQQVSSIVTGSVINFLLRSGHPASKNKKNELEKNDKHQYLVSVLKITTQLHKVGTM